jgi:hypothetical protein
MIFPIVIHRNLRPFWKFGFNKGWYYNEYRNNRFESCGYIIIYAFKRSIHILWSYKWYQWWLSTKQEFESKDNFIIFPFGFGYPKKKWRISSLWK